MSARVRIAPPSRRASWCQTKPDLCALCTSTAGRFVQRPFGRGNALLTVCERCDTESPRQGNYSFGDGIGARPPERVGGHRSRGRRAP